MMSAKSPWADILDRIQAAKNIIITVGKEPTFDDLTSLFSLGSTLKQLDKQIVAVYAGDIPQKIQFLSIDKNIEKSVDGLRDLVVSADKQKVAKVRTKVEGDDLKIFISPKGDGVSELDLNYDLGDLKTDLILVLGAKTPNDLNSSIGEEVDPSKVIYLGGANYSGSSELVADMILGMKDVKIDKQIANALLAGIVLATDQFGNAKTVPETLQVASELLRKGADQQLIIKELKVENSVIVPESPVIKTPPVVPTAEEPVPAPAQEPVEEAIEEPVIIEPEPISISPTTQSMPPLDLTIPPAPVIPKKAEKKVILSKLPKPKTNKQAGQPDIDENLESLLPPPPPIPDISIISLPTGLPTDTEMSLAPPPDVVTNATTSVAGSKSSDPKQFHIPTGA